RESDTMQATNEYGTHDAISGKGLETPGVSVHEYIELDRRKHYHVALDPCPGFAIRARHDLQ
ncbi:MAG: hypothetical protein MUF25_29370, partial [Pirellulaceae bacterium]|nr:hypothetical protein [Pirellulaceae bacterium]